MAERRLSPPAIPPPDDVTADDSERSIVVVSEEADALVESLTSYVEDTVSSLLGSPAAAAGASADTPSPVEIHQIPAAAKSAAAAAVLKARAEDAAQRDGGDGAAFFSCGDCTFGADSAEQAHPSPPRRPMHMHPSSAAKNSTGSRGSSMPPPPRAVTMEEPYFSDELSSVREMEALKRSVNDMQLTGAMHVASADSSSLSLPAAPALGVGQHRRTLSNNSRSRSLMTGKLSPEKLAESEHVVHVSSSAATDTANTAKHSRDESILFAAGPAEADLPPARPEPPEHERWAVASSAVDLSGDWTIIADERFRKQYNAYLANLGFGFVLRNVALGVIGSTTEHTRQTHDGRQLLIRGKNPRGVWERKLVASGYPDFDTHSSLTESVHYEHKKVTVETADSEAVEAEAWWEDGGTVHRSWLRGGKKYGGGDFESYRYLEEGSNGQVLVCRSIFHPNNKSKPRAEVVWRYKRDK